MRSIIALLLIFVGMSAAHALGKFEGRREAKQTIETFVDGYVRAYCRTT